MSASQHTPGPWIAEPSQFEGEWTIRGSNQHGCYVLPILGRTHNWPKNAEANARLISAAPDMLAALRSMVEAYREGYTDVEEPSMVREALAAIAKAEGN